MLVPSIAIIAGLTLLVWSADRFIAGAAGLARHFGASPLLIGLTVVALGTSAPEMVVSAVASIQGQPALAIGNAIGSNITNIGLILGLCACVRPLAVHSTLLRRELPLAMGLVLLSCVLFIDGALGRVDGVILLVGLAGLLVWLYRQATHPSAGDPISNELVAQPDVEGMSLRAAVGWTVAGLILLGISAQLLVWGAVQIATALGVSELVIGLTIVALGTSLPELAASMAGALRGEHDIAIGNVVGSNMFNLVVVLPLPGLIAPGAAPDGLLGRDLPAMALFTAALFLLGASWRGRQARISRVDGALLLCGFVLYEFILVHQTLAA